MLKSLLVACVMLMTMGLVNAGDVKNREGKSMIVKVCDDPDCNESPVSLESFTPAQPASGQAAGSCSSCSDCSCKRGHIFSKLKGVLHRPYLFQRRGCK